MLQATIDPVTDYLNRRIDIQLSKIKDLRDAADEHLRKHLLHLGAIREAEQQLIAFRADLQQRIETAQAPTPV